MKGGAAWKEGDVDGAIHWFSKVRSQKTAPWEWVTHENKCMTDCFFIKELQLPPAALDLVVGLCCFARQTS